MIVKPLQVDQLYQNTDPELFSFDNTEQLEDLTEIIGQPRAVEAVLFGTGMQSAGYNIYALGPPGTGKRTLILKQFQEQAAQEGHRQTFLLDPLSEDDVEDPDPGRGQQRSDAPDQFPLQREGWLAVHRVADP